ncbi:MAG TPA: glutamate--tRNA ligase [Steroidobacteraceae bacterium]|jgi:nondiscriminating glutamyl-tRNA synthetase|nr:glutamate--tRNA ligase [Steroidobacteraceae bacterium]
MSGSTVNPAASSPPASADGSPVTTRFAPSPTGELHLGNARTALFNLLLARHAHGRFILRVEDTDAERSKDLHISQQMADLRWLGIDWDAGPDREDERGPYRQSQRGAIYEKYFGVLDARGLTYPCFCTPVELEVSRRTQLAAGRPPRYAGTCRDLTPDQQAKKRAAGIAPTTRFRVPTGRRIEFHDFVHGPQSFLSDDIGDFVIRRADGSAAFFFSNAVDDATMSVTHVLRGEDHLTNTPRQLLILEALDLPAPRYGHVSLLVGKDGAPLSKRHGDPALRAYRERGYAPEAMANHLFRLGHSTSVHGFLTLAEMAAAFDPAHLGRAPARFDEEQLDVWQKEWVHRASVETARAWLAGVIPHGVDERAARAFIEAVKPNILLPADARAWADVVFGELPPLASEDEQLVRSAGATYFSAAASAAAAHDNDLKAIVEAVKAATGKSGAALYKPLRLALTGRSHGPELAPLLKAMPPGKARERLARFAA